MSDESYSANDGEQNGELNKNNTTLSLPQNSQSFENHSDNMSLNSDNVRLKKFSKMNEQLALLVEKITKENNCTGSMIVNKVVRGGGVYAYRSSFFVGRDLLGRDLIG